MGAVETVTPSRETLLRAIRSAATMIGSRGAEPEVLALLGVIDTCANELALREEPAFYQAYHAQGLALVAQGRELLGEIADPFPPEVPPETLHGALLDAAIGRVAAALESCVGGIVGRADPTALAFIRAATEWELALYTHRLNDGGVTQPATLFGCDEFETYLRARWPEWTDLEVTDFAMFPGGFSKFTVMIETRDAVNGPQRLVARVEPPVKFMDLDGMDVACEFPVVLMAYRAGLPLAEPLWLEDDIGKLGRRFFVSRRVAGSVMGTMKGSEDAIPRDVLRMLASTMARIHTTPLDRADPLIASSHLGKWLDYPSLRANSLGLVDYWAGQMPANGVKGSPILAEAIAWLRANVPDEDGPLSLIHGDIGLHNMIIEDGRLNALLDWENSRIGDPAEDFAMLFAGIGDRVDRAEFLELYREAGGPEISEQRLDWFAVYGGVYVTIGALAVLARLDAYEQANIAGTLFGLKYAHHYASSLSGLIEKAERRAALV